MVEGVSLSLPFVCLKLTQAQLRAFDAALPVMEAARPLKLIADSESLET